VVQEMRRQMEAAEESEREGRRREEIVGELVGWCVDVVSGGKESEREGIDVDQGRFSFPVVLIFFFFFGVCVNF
jgi:hypothetical protein